MEYDAARKIAQGLGAHLERLETLVEIKGDKARLRAVSERAHALFGRQEDEILGQRKKKATAQMSLFSILDEVEAQQSGWTEQSTPPAGATSLDRLHQAMLLFATGRSEALKRFLVDEGVGKDQRFWRLAQALSALYPLGSDEKRWVDGVLARKKGSDFKHMAREGAPHQTMCEAFTKRLQQLYPEPPAVYSGGRKIAMGLKPDVFIRHPDGRRWAYEMVHGNSHAAHLLDNHRRYHEAGIKDIWILWDDLRPSIGTPLSPQQGVILGVLPDQFLAQERNLTAPQKAILAMQPPGVKVLYAFSVSPLVKSPDIQFLDMLAIGVQIYTFQPVGQVGAYSVTKRFLSVAELEFTPDGWLKETEKQLFTDQDFPDILNALGYDTTQTLIPAEVIQRFVDLMCTQKGLQGLVQLLLSRHLQQAGPETLAEIALFRKLEAAKAIEPYQSGLSAETSRQIYDDPTVMKALAMDTQAAKDHVEKLELPAHLKQFLISLLDQPILSSSAEWMQWQAENEALQKARQNEKKTS